MSVERTYREPETSGTGREVMVEERTVILSDQLANDFRHRWEAIQSGFVDEPRAAVKNADALVAEAAAKLTESFSEERTKLEHQWDRGDEVSTEDLRMALRRYRAFFDRLLAI